MIFESRPLFEVDAKRRPRAQDGLATAGKALWMLAV